MILRRALAASALVAGAACSGSRQPKPADSALATTDSSPPATTDSSAVPRTDSSRVAPRPPTDTTVRPSTATPTATPTPTVTPSETVITGKVVAGGLAATPTTQLQIDGGPPMTLIGPLEAELRRLGGATIWATGAPITTAPNVTFSVSRYEIVSIDGAKPVVGTVRRRDGAVWLETERDTVRLVSAPAELAAKAGAKVWIVGRRSGQELTTRSYGVIRDP